MFPLRTASTSSCLLSRSTERERNDSTLADIWATDNI